MPLRSYSFSPPTNPFLQVVYFVVGGIVLIGALLMGAVILAIALGVAIVLGIIVYARVWWLQRKFKRSGGSHSGGARSGGSRSGGESAAEAEVLEVEYSVVAEHDARDERHERDGRRGGD